MSDLFLTVPISVHAALSACQDTRRSALPPRSRTKGSPVKDKNVEESQLAGLSRRRLVKYAGVGATLAAAAPLLGGTPALADDERAFGGKGNGRRWRAGDHHIHSE